MNTPPQVVAPEWVVTLVPWLLALLVVATAAAAAGVWLLVHRLRDLDALLQRLGALEEISSAVKALGKDRADLDLRRIEHVLIEMRDGERRLEDSLLRLAQAAQRPTELAEPRDELAPSYTERVVQRLLAHGYERVHVVPRLEELAELFRAEGAHEVLVEARRNGVLCKGRVLVRDGVVTDVEMQPATTMFP